MHGVLRNPIGGEMEIGDFAKKIDGVEYGELIHIKNKFAVEAKDNGFVIVYGASDDLIEFDGAYQEEVYIGMDGGIGTFDFDGTSDDGKKHNHKVVGYWCGKVNGKQIKSWEPTQAVWEISVSMPSEPFNIYEDGEVFCVGCIFKISDMK